jgi:hypothetical protein
VWEKRYVKLEVKDTRPRMCKRRLEIFWDFKEAIRLRYEGAKQSWERGFNEVGWCVLTLSACSER